MAELVREYIIETRRYTVGGSPQYDEWISDNENIKIEDNYLRFIPTKGKDKGKKIYLPLDNIHIVREK